MQAVPECAGSGCRLFHSEQVVGAGCIRVCRQLMQAVSEWAGFSSVHKGADP